MFQPIEYVVRRPAGDDSFIGRVERGPDNVKVDYEGPVRLWFGAYLDA